MQVINMLNNYRELVQRAKSGDSFHAFQDYTAKYSALFDGVLKYLYMTDLASLRPMIESIDFEALLNTAEENISSGYADQIITQSQAVVEKLGFTDEFDLYLGLEMGNIGGCSIKADTPFIYIALDRPLSPEFLKFYLPHEINHMVRIHALPDMDPFSFQERTLTEGLGSYAPLVHCDLPYTTETISQALTVPLEAAHTLLNNQMEIEMSVTAHFGETMTPELMQQFFTTTQNDTGPLLGGYFVGMHIVHHLVEAGLDFTVLTEMPSNDLWEHYLQL